MTLEKLLRDELKWQFTFCNFEDSGLKGEDFSRILNGLPMPVLSVSSTIELPSLLPLGGGYPLKFYLESTNEVVVWNLRKRNELLVGLSLFKDVFARRIDPTGTTVDPAVHALVSHAIDTEIIKAKGVSSSLALPSAKPESLSSEEEFL